MQTNLVLLAIMVKNLGLWFILCQFCNYSSCCEWFYGKKHSPAQPPVELVENTEGSTRANETSELLGDAATRQIHHATQDPSKLTLNEENKNLTVYPVRALDKFWAMFAFIFRQNPVTFEAFYSSNASRFGLLELANGQIATIMRSSSGVDWLKLNDDNSISSVSQEDAIQSFGQFILRHENSFAKFDAVKNESILWIGDAPVLECEDKLVKPENLPEIEIGIGHFVNIRGAFSAVKFNGDIVVRYDDQSNGIFQDFSELLIKPATNPSDEIYVLHYGVLSSIDPIGKGLISEIKAAVHNYNNTLLGERTRKTTLTQLLESQDGRIPDKCIVFVAVYVGDNALVTEKTVRLGYIQKCGNKGFVLDQDKINLSTYETDGIPFVKQEDSKAFPDRLTSEQGLA